MLFVWQSGYTKRISYSEQIRGLVHKLERPLFIVITEVELNDYIPRNANFSFSEYAIRVVSCLNPQGKSLFIKEPRK